MEVKKEHLAPVHFKVESNNLKQNSMEREIFFRGFVINSKEWVYSMTVSKGTIKRKMSDIFFEVTENNWVGVDKFSVSQFVGLLDKNERRVFAGDVCKMHDGSNWLICQDNLGVWSEKLPERNSWNRDFTPQIFCKEVEVIGNIYSNPELLK